jgi:hypothetical protein
VLTGRSYRRSMDTMTKAGPSLAGTGPASATSARGDVRGAYGSSAHACAVPGYLHLPDLAMIWQCADCGDGWQVVPARRSPGSPLEFDWVRDSRQPIGSLMT